ncbi:hypothetical protein H8E50_12645 [bacterium]|nr:hypothetical protein [bacterium]
MVLFVCLTGHSESWDMLDHIVAVVNEEAILLSELKSAMRDNERASQEEVLNTLVDRALLYNEAKKFRLKVSTKDGNRIEEKNEIIREYIDRRVKAFIYIPLNDIEQVYEMNRNRYKGLEFYEVRDSIDDELVEVELEKKLKIHIEELRTKSSIRIQLRDDY